MKFVYFIFGVLCTLAFNTTPVGKKVQNQLESKIENSLAKAKCNIKQSEYLKNLITTSFAEKVECTGREIGSKLTN